MFVVLSDGIFEARSSSGEILDIERVKEFFESLPPMPPAQRIIELRKLLVQWQGKESPIDDQTAVIIERDA